MDKKLSKLLSAFVIIFIIFYIGYQAYLMVRNPFKTQTTTEKTINETIDTEIFVVRDESYITNAATGTIVPAISDGSRVAKGQEVAVVFSDSASASGYTKIQEVQNRIERYKNLASQTSNYSFDIDSMDNKILSDLFNVQEVIDSGNLQELTDASDILRDQITSRQIATGTEMNFDRKISDLQSQLEALQSKNSNYSSVLADNSGYYISKTDGFENTYNYSNVTKITVNDIDKILKEKPQTVPGNAMGKLVNSFDWYIVCNISSRKIGDLKVGNTVTVNLPFSSVSQINAEVYAINDTNNGKSSLVLKSNYMDSSIANLRKEKAQLIINKHKGYKVESSAVREVKGVKGVYVLRGNLVSFRKVDIIYSNSDYMVVSPYAGKSGYLKLYDEVIVEGKGLYDGKVIE